MEPDSSGLYKLDGIRQELRERAGRTRAEILDLEQSSAVLNQTKRELEQKLAVVEEQIKSVDKRLYASRQQFFVYSEGSTEIGLRPSKYNIVDAAAERKLCELMPFWKLKPIFEGSEIVRPLVELEGPVQSESLQQFTNIIAAHVISTYPYITAGDRPERSGDPICDHYFIRRYASGCVVAVADGCNWGTRPATAAAMASRKFVNYVTKHSSSCTDAHMAGRLILRAFGHAHHQIIKGQEHYECGTTTLIGAALFPVDRRKKEDPRWAFVCGSVGDCKAFLWSKRTGAVTDITIGNRGNLLDASDCGGRLGPYLEEGAPDLRNLAVLSSPCETGDVFFLVSDGVHDNLDPQSLGKTPKDLGLPGDTWADAEKSDSYATATVKDQFRLKFIKRLIGDEAPDTKCAEITKKLIDYCRHITRKSRRWMEENPLKKQPVDYAAFPGKLDHTTCVAFVVGRCGPDGLLVSEAPDQFIRPLPNAPE